MVKEGKIGKDTIKKRKVSSCILGRSRVSLAHDYGEVHLATFKKTFRQFTVASTPLSTQEIILIVSFSLMKLLNGVKIKSFALMFLQQQHLKYL